MTAKEGRGKVLSSQPEHLRHWLLERGGVVLSLLVEGVYNRLAQSNAKSECTEEIRIIKIFLIITISHWRVSEEGKTDRRHKMSDKELFLTN